MPLSLPVASLLVGVLLWSFLRFVRSVVKKSPLDNIPGPASKSFLKGNFEELANPDLAFAFHRKISDHYGGIIKVHGPFQQKILYVFDPKALHHIAIKDQHIFEESDAFIAGNKLIFGDGLLGTIGDHHRKQRRMLNPVFSNAHMRDMVPIFYDVTYKLRDAISQLASQGPCEVDLLSWMSRTALELIGQAGLGYSFDPLLIGAPEHPYVESTKMLIPLISRLLFFRQYVLPWIHHIGTPRFRRWLLDVLPWKDAHELRDIIDVIYDTSITIYDSKKEAFAKGDGKVTDQVGGGKDILSILMRANMEAAAEDKCPESEVIAQMSTLIFSAMDTTANALARVLHLLSENQEAQDKLREEIIKAREEHHGELLFDELVSLPYLDAICRETLRLAHADAVLPFSKPVRGIDGNLMDHVMIPEGTPLLMSMLSSNTNPDLWGPDSYEWKPERWLSSLPETVLSAKVPGVYSHFQLEMKGKNIIWRMNNIAAPSVDGGLEPELPLMVELVKKPKA
ncbi:hypothetical protein EST38_g8727 [Candolleomyces aberdarensis]|uniref:Cytochrome P450 n=1 Tax=Candolleomyces aberdarensis TaxID=2316362 RepID=A0A4Q2DBQ0_9AGAR|nr:hypothetical protein EST38_g8727 [Candolleomyces aberdarensis]